MAKYIVDIPDEAIDFMGGRDHFSMFVEPECKVGDCKHYALRISKGDITPYTESDREAIEDEVWEFVMKCLKMDGNDFYEIFNNCDALCLTNLSYQDVKEKYEAWKRTKEEIRVGDEVEYEAEYECDGIVRFVVTGFCGETAFGFKHQCDYGDVGEYCDIEDLRKTGRHFDEVEELLKKMRESDEIWRRMR